MWETLLNGQEWRGSLLDRKKSGELFWVDSSYSAVKNTSGEITHYIAIQRDASSQRHTEDLLRNLSLAVQQSASTIVITNKDGAIEYVNPKFTDLTGYTAEEAIGQNPRILQSGLVPPEAYETMWKTILAGQEWRGEFCNKKKNGELYWEIGSITPIKDRDGHITHFLAVKEDITQLKQAQEELEARNRELDAYGHTIAHDLKNPLSVILNYSEMASTLLDPQAESSEFITLYLCKIEQGVNTMTRMIDQMLYFSQLRDAKETADTIQVEPIARRIIERFEHGIHKNQIAVRVETPMPAALCNDVWVEQVFANLIGNAVKYMALKPLNNTSNRAITVRGFSQGAMACYEVEDTGVGIAPGDQARLFDMFTRFHGGTETGLGLGLSIVQRIVTKSGGQIGVRSAPGEGSTFWFTLPLAK